MRVWLPVAVACILLLEPLPQVLARDIQINLQLSGTAEKVYIPGTGEFSSASLSNATYPSPSRNYIASYNGGVLKSLIFSGSEFISLSFARSGTDMHSLGLNMSLAGARALLAFTRGGWDSVENRIKEIESGKFFSYPNPTFGFGLGNTYAIKLLLAYADIKTRGNLTLQAGRQGMTFAYNGTTPDNKQMILISQAA